MSKLKKSIKAIIISICAVVVLAGSIVGVVLANKNKSGDTPSNDGGLNAAAVCNLTDAQKKFVKDLNESVSTANNGIRFAEIYDENQYLYEDGEKIDKSLIQTAYEDYFVSRTGNNSTMYLKVVDNQNTYYKNVYDYIQTQNIISWEFNGFENDVVSLRYVTYASSVYNLTICLLDVSDIDDVQIVYENEIQNIPYIENYADNDTAIALKDNYYIIAIDDNTNLFDVSIYTYDSHEKVEEYVVDENKLANFHADDNAYLFNQDDKFYAGYFADTFSAYEFDLENVSRYYTFEDLIFFEIAETIEKVEEKTELTVGNVNYSYKLYNIKTNEFADFALSNGFAKAYFNQSINGYIEVFEEKYVNDVKESGKFTYYDLNFSPIISYSADSIDQKIVYSNAGKFLSSKGILTTDKSVNASFVVEFNTNEFNYSLHSTTVNDNTFVVFDNNAHFKIMDMNGNFVFEDDFMSVPYSYTDGYYAVDSVLQKFILNTNTRTKIEISNFADVNHFIFNGGGYYFTNNVDESYSLSDYKGNLIYNDVKSFDFSTTNSKTFLKITKTNNEIVYFSFDRVINFDSNEEPIAEPYSASGDVETYGSQSGSGTGYSYTYDFGLGSDKSQYTFTITCDTGYYMTSGSFSPGRNATYDDGYVSFTETGISSSSYHDSTPSFSASFGYPPDFVGPPAPGGGNNYKYTISGDLSGSKDSEELIGTPSISCSKIAIACDYTNFQGTITVYSSVAYGVVGLNLCDYDTPTYVGKTFTKWTDDSSYVSDDNNDGLWDFYPTKKDQTVTFTANWTNNSYSISYTLNSGSYGTYYPTSLTCYTSYTISNPTRLGYTFTGWSISNMSTDINHWWGGVDRGTGASASSVTSTSNFYNLRSTSGTVSFTANWSANTYSISYVLDSGTHGTYHPTSGTYDSQFSLSNPTRVGYTFTGWSISGMSTNCTHYMGGVNKGTSETATGIKSTTFKNLRSTSGTVTFTATWKNNEYTISYVLNGGTHGDDHPTSATYGPAGGEYDVAISNPTRTGYTFTGWKIENMSTNCSHWWGGTDQGSAATATDVTAYFGFLNLRSTSGEVKFTANWSANEYTIKFNLNNPNSVTNDISSTGWGDVKVKYDADKQLTGTPTKTGYIFSHWSVSDMDESSSVTGEIVTHFYGDATSSYVDFTGTTLNDVTLPKYFKNLHSTSGTVTFKANWTPITYSLTYDANNGVFADGVNNPTSATYDVAFNVTTPIRHGYNFTKWTIKVGTATGVDYTLTASYPNSVTKDFINRTTTNGATVKFTANWTAVTYTIYYDMNNPNSVTNDISSWSSTSATYNTWKNISKPVKVGYLFDYWEITGTSSCNHKANCACFASADNGTCSHYYNTTNSDSGATRFTGTSLASTTATYFKNLHCTSGNTVTFKAHWVKKTYNVINAGSTYGATISTEYPKFDEVFSMEAPTSAPTGYHFDGWTITGANNKDENMTSYTVTHYYGTTNAASSTFTGTSKTVGSTVMFFKNLSSNNWTSASSTNAIVTISPVWTANTYTVTYNMNNPNRLTSDISSYSNTTATYDTAFSKSNPVKAGYTFTGWALSGLTDDCPHYYGTSSSSMTAFESNNNAYKDSETAQYVLLKSTYYKNLRSEAGTATLKANWRANTYTITYHYIPASFNVANYNASQLFTHINIAGNMTSTITETVTYDTKYEAINCKTELDEVVFPLPVGLKFKLWSISSSALSSSTSVAKYSGNVVVTALSDSIMPFEERIYGPGKDSDGALTWKHYSSNIHLYACYDLAGINLRYYGPSAASGENDLSKYSNLSAANTNVKYTEFIRFAGSSAVVDGTNLMGWMISADYLSDGQLTEHSITIFDYQSTKYVAYQGTTAYWSYTNVDAYSYEDPTYFLYAIYSNEYSGTTNALAFTYRDNTSGSLGSYFSPKFYSVQGTVTFLTSVKIPKYYNDGTHGFLPVEQMGDNAFWDCNLLTTATWFDSMRMIGTRAFYDCTALTTFTLNAGLHTIGESSFENCSARTSLVMPASLRVIGNSAFKSCTNVSTLTLNEGLLTIGDSAFYDLNKVTSVSLPSTLVGEIGTYAFYNLRMTSVTIPKGVTSLAVGVFEDCSKLATVSFATGCSLRYIGPYTFNATIITSINIPNSVTYMGHSVFYECSKLATVTLPDSLETLDHSVFRDCAALTAITLPKNLTSIPNYTFYGCAKLASVTIYSGITSIGQYAFSHCSSLTSLVVPNTVTSIGQTALYGCSKLATLSIPFVGYNRTTTSASQYYFGFIFGATSYSVNSNYIPTSLKKVYVTDASKVSENAFYNCSYLTHLYINKGVTSMGQNAFYGCSALVELSIPFVGTSASDTTYCYLGYFFGQGIANSSSSVPTTLKTVHVTNATTIGSCAFYKSSVTTVNLNEGITSIGPYAFQHTKLTGITFPRTLTSIGEAAFANVETLTSANFNEGLTSIGNYAFNCTRLTTVVIPQTVTSIGQYAFNGITTLTTLTLFDGLTSMGSNAFSSCLALTAVKIPRTVTSIPYECFFDCTSLISVTLPNTITSIGAYAFYNCTALTSITIPNSVTSIGAYAFQLAGLTSIYLPDSVTSIGEVCFANCYSLTSVRLSNNLTAIPNDAFCYTDIGRLEIPASVTTVGMSAFYDCNNLTDVLCYGAVEDFAVNTSYPAFNECDNLTYFYYGGNSDYFYSYPMYEWNYEEDALTKYLCWPNMIFNFDHMQFTYHSATDTYSFKSKGTIGTNDYMSIPSTYYDGINGRKNVTVIEENAFYGKSSMPQAILPNTITTIGASAFYGCSAMSYSNMPTSVQSIGAYAYYGCSVLAVTFTIPDAVSHIDDNTFSNCQKLGIKFNSTSTLKYIGNYAFSYLSYNAISSRKYIMTIPNSVTYIGSGAFYYALCFTGDLKLPSGLLYLGDRAFYENDYITRVEIPRTLDSLNEATFYSCYNLRVVYIPNTIKSIPTRDYSAGPFYACSPTYNTAPGISIYLESDSIPSGWGKYWNYTYSTTKKANTFYNYPKMPNAYLSNANTSYYLTQDSEGVFKVNLTTKVSQSNNPGLVISAQYFVNVRFEYMIYSKNVDVDMCVEINGSEYPVSLLGSQTTTYQYYSRLLKPGDVMKILLGNHKCAASYACGMYVKNLRIEPIENFGGFDFGMSGDTLYSTNDGVDGNYNIDGDYYNEYNDGEYWMDYYGEYAGLEHYSASGFTYYATDYCEVSFGYNSFSERDYDYVRAVVNGSLEVVADVECYGGNYNRILNPGDYITIYYRKDVSVGTDEGYEDIGYIENFYIAKIQEFAFNEVSTSSASVTNSNATTYETFDVIGQWTRLTVTSEPGYEILYKAITTKKYNAKMRFVLYNTDAVYYSGAPYIQITTTEPNSSDNLANSVAYGYFLPGYYRATLVEITIPNPDNYYIALNLHPLSDGGTYKFDFYCLDFLGVDARVGTYTHHDSNFDNWSSTACGWTGYGKSFSRAYDGTSYYNQIKDGSIRFRSSNKSVNTISSFKYIAPNDGVITFTYDISSESGHDLFHLYLNNSLILMRSGDVYDNYAVSMKKGDILEFRYRKDGSQDEGDDQLDIYNFKFRKCYVFDYNLSNECYVPGNIGAQNSTSSLILHPSLSNISWNSYLGDSPDVEASVRIDIYLNTEKIHDKIEIYNSFGDLIYTTYNKETDNTHYIFNYSFDEFSYGTSCTEYLEVLYIKDGSIDVDYEDIEISVTWSRWSS